MIEALRLLNRPCKIVLHVDSSYVKDGITKWIDGWKAKNWRTANKQPVKNVDLWQALEEQIARHEIEWRWVKGHAGIEGNEKADRLANKGCEQMRWKP